MRVRPGLTYLKNPVVHEFEKALRISNSVTTKRC